MSLVKSTATIGFFTLISRITGFLRDVLMANAMGASFLSDAFFVAFKLPNFFRRLFAEGAFNAAFVPSFAAILTSEGRQEARQFASEVLSVLLVVLLVLNAVFIVFMPWITPLFAPGFTDDPEKLHLTVVLSQICFPYILFISLVSLLGGILNSINKFAAPAANPILLNLCMIAGLLYLTDYTETPAHAQAIAVFIAGIVQLGWLIAICRRHDMLPSLLVPRMTKRLRSMLILMAPAALGSGVQQVNLLVDVIIASSIPEAISYLYYADRITELPIGMIGVAVGTALLPMLSKQIREGALDKVHHTMNRGLEITMLFGLPAMVACLVIATPMINVLYLHGAFTAADATATAHALMAFAVGLPAFLAVKVLAPGFFANHDTKTPFRIAVVCVVINLVLNLILIHPFKHVGMAMATSAASWVNVLWMAKLLHQRNIFVMDRNLKIRSAKMLAASLSMGAALLALTPLAAPYWHGDMALRVGMLLGLIAAGGAVYGVMLLLLRTVSISDIKRTLTRT
jgi:putative peptidoglycan lipid II flippase